MEKTIAAVSTAFGKGGIAVIRISGEDAVGVADRMFRPASGKPVIEYESGRAVYGDIIKNGERIDDGICTIFRAPRSYTGEDTAEISCHGGILITSRVLEAAFECGAVQAGAGEFTRRAFTNGRLSLSQTEAVGLVIDAVTDEQLKIAASQRRGNLRKKCDELYESLKNVVTNVYAGIDFPDEDLTLMSDDEVKDRLETIHSELESLRGSYGAVRAASEGLRCVIAGKPNTGKSSLLNRLVGRDRAIVTDIAGTTRDTIEETVPVGKVLLRLCDTAGIRETEDKVEKIGVDRALDELSGAELVLAVFDASVDIDDDDRAILERLSGTDCVKIALINKTDAADADGIGECESCVMSSGAGFECAVRISAKSGDGIDTLSARIEELYSGGKIDYDTAAVLVNARQNASVTKASECIARALRRLRGGYESDTIGFELEEALCELGELDGRRVSEEIVDGIFHHFCVGK